MLNKRMERKTLAITQNDLFSIRVAHGFAKWERS